jgi:hypothetical protein
MTLVLKSLSTGLKTLPVGEIFFEDVFSRARCDFVKRIDPPSLKEAVFAALAKSLF